MTGMIELRVSDLKQYAYCPRVVFYQYIMPVEKVTTFKMSCGKRAEKRIERLEARRGLKRYGLMTGKKEFHKPLRSRRLALSGTLDLLVTVRDGYFPVDFKFTGGRPHCNHLYQLCGYALILEDVYSAEVNRGFVYIIPAENIFKFDITDGLKENTLKMLDEIREMIAAEKMPEACAEKNRCIDCEYKNYCGDVF